MHRKTGADDPLSGVAFGGATAGSPAPIVAVQTPMWVEGMSAGKGWIALALVVFGTGSRRVS